MNKEEHTLPEGYYNSQYHTYLHYTEDSFMDCNPKSYKYILQLEDEIENLQKEAEQGEHYKHLYSEVKKQKDDGIDWIKNNYCYVGKKMSLKPFSDLKDLLRMLGEIDE